MIASLITLMLLILIQCVLGLDNLLYISLASKKVPEAKQSMVRKWGIGLAIILRIVLLFALMHLIKAFEDPLFGMNLSWAKGSFNVHSIIVLGGGIFVIYTAMKEILHMMSLEHDKKQKDEKPKSIGWSIFWIVLMNIVFSIDSILSAMALTDVFWVMCTAIVIGGLLMIWLAERVSKFLTKNRMYEVLGLFILFVVGIMLVTEGGHLAGLELFGETINPMAKVEFYFILGIIILIDVVQTKYQKKIDMADSEPSITNPARKLILDRLNHVKSEISFEESPKMGKHPSVYRNDKLVFLHKHRIELENLLKDLK